MTAPLEKTIQTGCVKSLEAAGWVVLKVILCNKPGWPDLMAIKGGRVVFIEVKREGGRLSELQKLRGDQIRRAGCEWYVVYSVAEMKGII